MSNPNGHKDDWSSGSQELFRAARSDHAPSAADRERVRRALAQRLAATPSGSSGAGVTSHAASTLSRVLTIGFGVSLALVATIAVKRNQEASHATKPQVVQPGAAVDRAHVQSSQLAARGHEAALNERRSGADDAALLRGDALQVGDLRGGVGQGRDDATQAREGAAQWRDLRAGASQGHDGAAQARGSRGIASQGRDGAAQARDPRGGAWQGRDGTAQGRDQASRVRDQAVQARDRTSSGRAATARSAAMLARSGTVQADDTEMLEREGAAPAQGSAREGASPARAAVQASEDSSDTRADQQARGRGDLEAASALGSVPTSASANNKERARAAASGEQTAPASADAQTTAARRGSALAEPSTEPRSEALARAATAENAHATRKATTGNADAMAKETRVSGGEPRDARASGARASGAEQQEGSAAEDARAELAFVRKMQSALRAGDSDDVLELSAEHRERWPHGTFVQEREGLRAIAACNTAASNAAANAHAFLANYPRTPLGTRVREACNLPTKPPSRTQHP